MELISTILNHPNYKNKNNSGNIVTQIWNISLSRFFIVSNTYFIANIVETNRKPRKKTSGTELSFNAAYFFSTQQYLVILPLLSILHRL